MDKQELDDHWVPSLVQHQITRIMIDSAFTVQLAVADVDIQIRIEVPFLVRSQGHEYVCNPAQPQTLLPILDLFLKEVTSVTVFKSGILAIKILPDIEVIVSPDAQFEAWNISDNSSGPVATAMPGGSVAFWEFRARSAHN